MRLLLGLQVGKLCLPGALVSWVRSVPSVSIVQMSLLAGSVWRVKAIVSASQNWAAKSFVDPVSSGLASPVRTSTSTRSAVERSRGPL